ncbi:hypothetical protein SEA_DATBOI_48 [Gordonia phage DatBoi]|nr:hypothetical protein SEA_DATBOI_48 [Gordonia phage DatBoi]
MSPRKYTLYVAMPALLVAVVVLLRVAAEADSLGGLIAASCFAFSILGLGCFILRHPLRVSHANRPLPMPPVAGPPTGYDTWGQFLAYAPAAEVHALLERGRR